MSLTAIVTGSAPTPDRNNYTGQVGIEILTARAMTITFLGRPVGSSFANSHDITIWRESDSVLMGTATVTTSSPTLNGWAYASCGSVSLASGVKYRIVSAETNGGDNWKDESSFTAYSGSDITSVKSCYGSAGVYPGTVNLSANAFVHLNLYEGSEASPIALFDNMLSGGFANLKGGVA